MIVKSGGIGRHPRMKLSVVMPVYNERATLREVVQKVLAVSLEIELICVDDGSRDGSREILSPSCSRSIHKSALFCSRIIWARERRSGAAFRRLLAISSSFRMPIWNTIRRSIR